MLTKLNCDSNEFALLDISKNTALVDLQCSSNKLTTLDLSNNIALTKLYCAYNSIKSLDVSNNALLTVLSCGNNQLTSLDISKNDKLTDLVCNDNKLTSLALNQGTALKYLVCGNNNLTELDLNKNIALVDFDCSGNSLEKLDVSGNTELNGLWCYGNNLTGVDLRNNKKLDNVVSDIDGGVYNGGVNLAYNRKLININKNDRIFDLHELEKYGFDVELASDWNGGTVDGWMLTVDDSANLVTYEYDVQHHNYVGTVTFTLLIESDKPVDPDKTVNPDKPIDSDKPVDPDKPVVPDNSGNTETEKKNYPTVIPIGGADTSVTPEKIASAIERTNKVNAAADMSQTGVTQEIINAFVNNDKAKKLIAQYGSKLKIEISKEDITGKTKAMDFSLSGKSFLTKKQISASRYLRKSLKNIQLDFNQKGKINGINKVTVKARTSIQYEGRTAYIYEYVGGKLVKIGECTVKSRGFIEFETDHLGQFVIAVK